MLVRIISRESASSGRPRGARLSGSPTADRGRLDARRQCAWVRRKLWTRSPNELTQRA